MSYAHSKNTTIKVGASDISLYVNDSKITRGRATHDTTGYKKDDLEFDPGLRNSAFEMSGTYENSAGGPRAVLVPLYESGAKVTYTRQPEGTASGKPQEVFSGMVEEYVESNPVNDMIKWSAKVKVSGMVDSTPQP